MTETDVPLQQLLAQLDRIWQEYRQSGPGGVNPVLFERAEPTAAALTAALSESSDADAQRLVKSIETAVELARRCVYRAGGLCFVTGEAGLVPRRDLHERFEAALAAMRASVDQQ